MDQSSTPSTGEITQENQVGTDARNLYPFLRKTLFILLILFFSIIILFLVYQNGKSIYDNGL